MNAVQTVWDAVDAWVRVSILALVWAVIVQTTFVVVYGMRRPWRDYFVGRALMFKSFVVAVGLALSVVSIFWTYPCQKQVNTVLSVAVAFAVTYQLISLLRTPAHLDPPRE